MILPPAQRKHQHGLCLAEEIPKIPITTSPSQFQLRDFQNKTAEEILNLYGWGIKSLMLAAPVAAGKTLIIAEIVKHFALKGERSLIVVNQDLLIDQTVDTLIAHGIAKSDIGYIKAGYPVPQGHERVYVASIQTLAHREYPPGIDLVVFDEAHTTGFYQEAQKLIEHYAGSPVMQLSKVKFLFSTGTAFRTTPREYFGNRVQMVVPTPGLEQLTEQGYSVPAKHYSFEVEFDFSQLELDSHGEFELSRLRRVCQLKSYNQSIVAKFLQTCPNRKAIFFAVCTKQSKLLAKSLNDADIATEHIDANTPPSERLQILWRFKMGITQVVCNVGILAVGFDEPTVEAIVLAYPTTSVCRLWQMCGRGLRLSPQTGKQDCLLLDFGGNFQRLGTIYDELDISLCPRPRKLVRSSTKYCPKCRLQVSNYEQICPDCHHEFSRLKHLEPSDVYIGELCEIHAKEPNIPKMSLNLQPKPQLSNDKLSDDFTQKLFCWACLASIVLLLYCLL